MKFFFQKHFVYLLILTLLLTCISALAEVKTWQLTEDNISIYYEMTRFDTELPDDLLKVMEKTPWAGWQCIKGIRQEERVKKTKSLKGGAALAAVQKDGLIMLLQFTCPDGKTWDCVPAAEQKALLTGRDYNFDAVLDSSYPRVEIIYPCEDGGREVFRLAMNQRSNGPIMFEHYRREYADSSMLTIGARIHHDLFFYIETKSSSGAVAKEEFLQYLYPNLLEALDADRYPKTIDEVQSYMAVHPLSVPAGYGILSSSNMREKASSQSKSLGFYQFGTPAKILGTAPGKREPWYKVQVGQTVGFVSASYILPAENMFLHMPDPCAPLTVGRTNKDCELKTTAGEGSGTAAKVSAGTAMYVLADCGDWLHVCIPRSEVGYWMDIEGTYGYLRAQDATQADTPLRLKYTGTN
jgi:hypothetical protein